MSITLCYREHDRFLAYMKDLGTILNLGCLRSSDPKYRIATRQTLPAETDFKNDCDLTTLRHRTYGRALAHMKGLHNHNKNNLDC